MKSIKDINNSKNKVVIIDYNMGNLTSVVNAIKYVGGEVMISNKIEDIKEATHLILPGVGAFGDGMKNLKDLGLIELLREQVMKKEKPFLGICLGMQLLAEKGYEGGLNEGLGYIKGEVKRFDFKNKDLRVPHVGWNEINLKKDCPLFNDLKESEVFYFVHSYHLILQENDIITGTCDYGGKFVATIQKNNIFATQFHPEKSQKPGLKILKNFINYKKC